MSSFLDHVIGNRRPQSCDGGSCVMDSVKHSDVTGNSFEWLLSEIMLYKPPPPYCIVLDCQVKTLQVKAVEFQRIECEI